MDFFFSTSTLSVMAAIGAAALAGYLVGRVRRARRGGKPRPAAGTPGDRERSVGHRQK
jgi:hypothetical protein